MAMDDDEGPAGDRPRRRPGAVGGGARDAVDPIGGTVRTLSLGFLAAIAAWSLIAQFLFVRSHAVLVVTGGIAAFLLGAYGLARAGRSRPAAGVLVAGVWLGTTWAVAISGSVSGGVLSTYLVAIIAASLLLGARIGIGVAALSAMASLGLAWLETHGRLPAQVASTPWANVALELTLFFAAAGLLADALGRLRSALARAEESEARTRALIEQASDGIVILAPDGELLDVNERFVAMTRFAREELVGRNMADFLESGMLEENRRLMRDLAPGEVRTRDHHMPQKGGTYLDVEDSISILQDGRAQILVRDVTERKRAEAMQERLRAALDQAGEGIVLFDPDLRVLTWNAAYQRFHSEPLRLGMHVREMAYSEERRRHLSTALAELERGRSVSQRIALTLEEGVRICHGTLAPVHGEGGEVVGYVGLLRDVTREAELEESLQVAQKLESVGRLAGGLAHDFNNLLTVILGAAELIRESNPSEDVDEILEAGLRAAALTTKLLALSRHQRVVRRPLDLNEAVAEIQGMLRRLVRENVDIEWRLADEPLVIEADPSQIHQVLVNLVANAGDAMPEGGILEIATGPLELSPSTRGARDRLPDGSYAVLSVRDAGEGMSDQVQERLFEPFFTTKAPGRGTGIGLASVHAIVQQLDGAIDVESQLGKGSTLRVLVPRMRGEERPAEEEPVGAGVGPAEPVQVLVVEDDSLVRAFVRRSLESRGHRVSTAATGSEGLAAALAEPPDLLVTDVVLPGLDGVELTARLRERRPGLLVLFTSGYSPEEVGGGVREDERTAFLPKPFTVEQLLHQIDRLFESRSADAGSA